MAASKHTPYFETLEALQAGDCPVCVTSKRSVDRYLDTLLYEAANDPGVRARTRAAHGFCRLHAWQMRRHGGSLEMAIIYRDVVRDAVAALEGATYVRGTRLSPRALAEAVDRDRPNNATAPLVEALSPQGECPACRIQLKAEAMNVDVLLEHLADEKIAAAMDQGGSLCLPHLRLALQRVRGREAHDLLLERARRSYSALLADLDEMIRLSDYRFRDQQLGDVGDTWITAIARVAGEDGLA